MMPAMVKDNTRGYPHPPCLPDLAPYDFFLFPGCKIKLKCRHFDTIELIVAKSQVVLNTPTELDF
jgi:hypothetical protein